MCYAIAGAPKGLKLLIRWVDELATARRGVVAASTQYSGLRICPTAEKCSTGKGASRQRVQRIASDPPTTHNFFNGAGDGLTQRRLSAGTLAEHGEIEDATEFVISLENLRELSLNESHLLDSHIAGSPKRCQPKRGIQPRVPNTPRALRLSGGVEPTPGQIVLGP
jgi:hypothetical protein